MKRIIICLALLAAAAGSAYSQVELQLAFPNLTFVRPTDLQHAGDGSNRLFLVEKRGRIWVFDSHPDVTSASLFLNIEGPVNSGGNEEGLLGLAFHPEYPDSPYFYVNYTASNPRRTKISRFNVSGANPDSADAASELLLLEYGQPASNHNGGQVAFGPDGYLYIASGDGGFGGDPLGNGQNLQTLLGALLRIDVDSPEAPLNYGIPPDNPFVDNTQGYREEIYAYGLRNPWRFSFDPPTGRLWLGDVGQNAWEEIDVIENGGNYGWVIMEGNHCYPADPCDMTGLELPVWEYAHPAGASRSVTGGYVYRGTVLQDLIGKYIYADFQTGEIWALEYDGVSPPVNTLLIDSALLISNFGIDENRSLYVCDHFGGRIYRLLPTVTGVGDSPRPRGRLNGNYPNPFNPTTTIEFVQHEHSSVEISIFDVEGKRVRTLARRPYGPGTHRVTWDGRNALGGAEPSGVYFYRLLLDGEVVDTRRMVLLK